MLVACLDVTLLFVSKTNTFDSPNSLHLKIFGFIRYDFECSRDKESFSIPQTSQFIFFDFKVNKKNIMTYYDILHPGPHGSFYNVYLKSYFLLFSVYLL